MANLIHVDDQPGYLEDVRKALPDHIILSYDSAQAFKKAHPRGEGLEDIDLVILDGNIDGVRGGELMKYLEDHGISRPTIGFTTGDANLFFGNCFRYPHFSTLLKRNIYELPALVAKKIAR